MVGGGIRKEDAVVINSTNVFAALGSLRKKKKGASSDKGSASRSKNLKGEKKSEIDPQVFWAPAPLNTKSWADVEDEDDDDYFATTAPPKAVWDSADETVPKESFTAVEESESEEEEGLDEVDDENEEDPDHEQEPESEPVTPVSKKPAEVVAPRESERQLSKKELKKKELAELDAVLAELGLATTEEQGGAQDKKAENPDGETDKKETVAAGESKSAKKKKKKDKSSKDTKEQLNGSDIGNGTEETVHSEKAEDAPVIDVKEKIKKVASAKKKKSGKELDAAAKAAASEAAARNSRLAAAKKKEKNHYNQQPMR